MNLSHSKSTRWLSDKQTIGRLQSYESNLGSTIILGKDGEFLSKILSLILFFMASSNIKKLPCAKLKYQPQF